MHISFIINVPMLDVPLVNGHNNDNNEENSISITNNNYRILSLKCTLICIYFLIICCTAIPIYLDNMSLVKENKNIINNNNTSDINIQCGDYTVLSVLFQFNAAVEFDSILIGIYLTVNIFFFLLFLFKVAKLANESFSQAIHTEFIRISIMVCIWYGLTVFCTIFVNPNLILEYSRKCNIVPQSIRDTYNANLTYIKYNTLIKIILLSNTFICVRILIFFHNNFSLCSLLSRIILVCIFFFFFLCF